MNPRVSVVVPAYRNVEYLAQTLDSILAQDYDDFELVVADHSSNDGTDALLARYADHPRVRVLSPTPTGGGAKANWDRVSMAARGELLKLVCGDDLIAPNALSRQVAALDAHPSAVLVASKRDLVDAQGKVIIAARGLGALKGLVSGRDAVRASVLAGTNLFGEPGCVMFRRELLVQAGGWDNSHPYLIDQASYSAIMLQGDMVALRESLASFRINAGQWSVRLMNDQAQQAIDFHNALAAADPQLLSPMTLRLGNLKARLMAQARRLTYLWLGRRMGAA
ncbi:MULTISPECIES: glycosyltransferase family 2 protein [Stenotrophomonas]|jgi:glycosyltransferase involved in cell wall biosynthesis|uniref:glycosyltransferase family 2 protein n=1 Tax=Stenotrophomonas TaxID=40323 RepID=UPI000D391D46|nr:MULTISPECIES: glycosyltransferase family A protein [Stenotrophomonas]PTT58860.1 glycosyl transferase [Stenotrophomonas sp. HMWF022]PTS73523.1 glycosyl transferase [Stenotrophomonas sp. HMWF023]CAH0196880.1 Spore coat polysaccharide biosynthesis protein SpsA [Stenotrophomonas lactitubi]CAH0214614.1 Spore coat polysaccharide biosynthesis protein SpsA [Stenotrophomonas lactitubi]CAH0235727.1 Spore coat polysaccharide biosynthesis protein SpsA [Stenotrophomonas lactitubi]